MKKTLLEIVKDILSDTDGEDVNTVSDTVESLQVAKVVEQTFYDLISNRTIPEHESLLKLTSLSDSEFPTHFVLEDEQAHIKALWYDVSLDGSYEYRQIKYLEPLDFLKICDKRSSAYTLVEDKVAGTRLRIGNDSFPTYFTAFDDKHIVMDSYKSSVDDVLRNSKVRSFGTTYPTFLISDTFVPPIDAAMFPYLVQEAKSRCFSIQKGGVDQKTEQAARRNKIHVQNDKRRVTLKDKLRNYGRG